MKRLSSREYARLLLATAMPVSAGQRTAVVRNFLALLRRQRALKLLPRIMDDLQVLDDQARHRTRVHIATARPLDERRLHKLLTDVIGEVVFEVRSKPELIGGLTIHFGDTELDASVRTQLARLRTHLIHA